MFCALFCALAPLHRLCPPHGRAHVPTPAPPVSAKSCGGQLGKLGSVRGRSSVDGHTRDEEMVRIASGRQVGEYSWPEDSMQALWALRGVSTWSVGVRRSHYGGAP